MTAGAYNRFAVLLTLQSTDAEGGTASFQRHLHPVNGFSSKFGPPARDLTTAISSEAMCATATAIAVPPGGQMLVDQSEDGADGKPPSTDAAIRSAISSIEAAPPEGKHHLVVVGNGYEK